MSYGWSSCVKHKQSYNSLDIGQQVFNQGLNDSQAEVLFSRHGWCRVKVWIMI